MITCRNEGIWGVDRSVLHNCINVLKSFTMTELYGKDVKNVTAFSLGTKVINIFQTHFYV